MNAPLPVTLKRTPRLDRWLTFEPGGEIEARSGKVEIGQGILTALAQIVADELDVPIGRIRMRAAETGTSPDEAVTSGSLSIQESGAALRQACAEVRSLCLREARSRWDVAPDCVRIEAGEVVADDGRRASYAELSTGGLLAREATGTATPKALDAHRVVGCSVARTDLADKINGRAEFIHDLQLEGMCYARVLHGPLPGSTLLACDEAAARSSPGILRVLRDGNLVGVAGVDTASVDRAFTAMEASARWGNVQPLPDASSVAEWLRQQPTETQLIADRTESAVAGGKDDAIAFTHRASYSRPFIAHGAIAPSCAIAHWRAGRLEVWSHSQGIYNLRRDLAIAFQHAEDAIVVRHVQGSGCYGHNGADDVAFDAAWLARAMPDVPVRVQWSRADELSRSPFGAAMTVDIEAGVAEDGSIVSWRQQVWSNGHSSRPGRAPVPTLLGASQTAVPTELPVAINMPPATGGGADRNATPAYDIPSLQVLSHRVLTMPLRTSALRSLGAFANVFAIESFIDEIAQARSVDPLEFRLQNLSDPRARHVLERAAGKAGWHGRARNEGHGFGIGWARYKTTGAWCAVVAEVEAQAQIRVRRLTIVVDVGLAINPDGVVNQIEGGAIQACSWVLKEAVHFDRERIRSDSWEEYPILRFSEIPAVDVEIVASEAPSLGAGEASLGPTAAAIGNAVHEALGLRVRDLPMTAQRLIAVIESQT